MRENALSDTTKRYTNETRIRTGIDHDGNEAQCANAILPATKTLPECQLKLRCVDFEEFVDPSYPRQFKGATRNFMRLVAPTATQPVKDSGPNFMAIMVPPNILLLDDAGRYYMAFLTLPAALLFEDARMVIKDRIYICLS